MGLRILILTMIVRRTHRSTDSVAKNLEWRNLILVMILGTNDENTETLVEKKGVKHFYWP